MRNELRTIISAALIAFLISFGGIACMVTAFGFDDFNMLTLVLFCLLFSLITAAIAGAKHSFWVVLAGALLLIGIFARQQAVDSFRFLLQSLTRIYDMAYGCGIYAEDYGYLWLGSLTLALCIIAGIVITTVVWTVHKRFTAIPAVALGILPLASCLVVTDTVPAGWAIFLLLTGLVLLMLTNSIRRKDAVDGNRLTALLLIPVCLMNLLLFWAIPREGYQASKNQFQLISNWFWQLPFMPNIPGNIIVAPILPVLQGVEVNLDELGWNIQSDKPVMTVTAENGGLLYLRGQAYDLYTGTDWKVRKDLEGGDLGWPTKNLRKMQTVQVRPISPQPSRFFPYYIQRDNWLEDYENGRLLVRGQNKEYIFSQAQLEPGYGLTEENRLTEALYEHYLSLPDSAEQSAERILRGLELGSVLSTEEKAEIIADHVRQTASYDLMTDRMPEDKQDFAIWFLEEGTTGYCVHFATAATVLLRAAGIPARYVTGYLTYANADAATTVTAKQAHAWVEYYDPTTGWGYLEPTPGGGLPDGPAAPPEDHPPETTEPEGTTEPENTGDPSGPSKPNDKPIQPLPSKPGTTEDSGGGGIGGGQGGKADRTWLWKSLKVLAWISGIAALLWLQFWARRRWRHIKMHSGHPNKRCLARWREVLRFCRILKTEPPEELLILAEKARFSQHRILPEELKSFDSWLRRAKRQVKEKKLGFLYRLFWAV